MPRLVRIASVAAALLGLLAVAALLTFLWYRQASLPLHEGTLSVPGPEATIEIARDDAGVPHIRASTEADVLFGLGFAHAQDRLWQMDFNRRLAQGRLAELVGPAGLDIDRFVRALGVVQIAQRMADEQDGQTRTHMDAYAAGVNAALQARTGPLPPEFIVSRAPAPAPWSARDSAALAVLMALDLSQNWRDEIARLQLAARMGKAEIDDVRPDSGGGPPFVDADYPQLYRLLGVFAPQSALFDDARRLAALPSPGGFGSGEGVGSNNWVVAGARTQSGAPLLANDPHLAFTRPGIFYFASLQAASKGLRAFGATVPGIPYVLLGRNEHVAWGMTNTEGDAEDFYLERLHPTDPTRYQTPDGWASFDVREETLRVRGQQDVVLTVRSTRHGPVLSDVLPPFDAASEPARGAAAQRTRLSPQYVLALRWAAAEPGDASIRAFARLNRARSAADVLAALGDLHLIRQNVVFAAKSPGAGQPATIGLQVAGRFPLRKPENELRGGVPAPGWAAQYDWASFVDFEDLPRVIDPPAGFIATANHRVATRPYPLHLGTTFAPPYRIDRINELLAAQEQHTVASMQRIQLDQTSLAVRRLLPLLTPAQPESEAARVALARLQQWDGTLRAQAPEPLLFHAWLRELRRRIFEDDLGEPPAARGEAPAALLGVLEGRAVARDWCDDRSTQRRETCAEVLAESLEASVAALTEGSGRDVLGLRWGEQHPAVMEHRPLSGVPVLRGWFERRLPVGGDAQTINVATVGTAPGAPFAARHGPVMRFIADLSDGGGAWISASAQQGHPWAGGDVDLAADWQQGRYRPIAFDAGPRRILTLQPAR